MNSPESGIRKAYLELHISVLLFGLTAVLGELIQLSGPVLVWFRLFITCIWSDTKNQRFN